MAKTESIDIIPIVKESGKGTPYLSFDFCEGEPISVLKGANVGLTLVEGTSIETAKEIAKYLKKHIKGLFYTKL
jgi:hypothetical protein